MKKHWGYILLFTLAVGLATRASAEEALRAALQQGLLAEESEHNLKEAEKYYRAALREASTMRQLEATALFRLAEVQRRLGQKDEALAEYERLVREFPDQAELVPLARRQLGVERTSFAGDTGTRAQLEDAKKLLAERRATEAELRHKLDRYESMDAQKRIGVMAVNEPAPELTELRRRLNEVQQKLAEAGADLGPEHPGRKQAEISVKVVAAQLDAEVNNLLQALSERVVAAKERVDLQQAVIKELEAENAAAQPGKGDALAQSSVNDSRAEQKRLYAEEIALAEQQLAMVAKMVENGQASQETLIKARRDVISLKRQMAAVEPRRDLISVPVGDPAAAPATLSGPKVTVYGEMQGVFPIPDGRKVMLTDVILGLGKSEFANLKKIKVQRVGADGKEETQIINVDKVLKDNDRSADFEVKDGDRIMVPRKAIAGF